jgi:hypothetical protein
MTPLPDWLRRKLYDPIVGEFTEGYRKIAIVSRCIDCRQLAWHGMDHDPIGKPARADLRELNQLGELGAHLDGRSTYRLRGHTPRSMTLTRRDWWDIKMESPGDHDTSGDVIILAEHRCGQPIPTEWSYDDRGNSRPATEYGR